MGIISGGKVMPGGAMTIQLGQPNDRKPPFKFSAFTRVGFSDTDAQGIVYYGRYLPYFDHARREYHRHLGLTGTWQGTREFVMRAMTVEYEAPAVFDDLLEKPVQLMNRVNRDLRHFQQHAVARQSRQGRAGPPEAYIEQLDECVVLHVVELHQWASLNVDVTLATISSGSNGFTTKPDAPASATRSCDDVWTSAETTITFTAGSSSRSFDSTSSPYIPFMTRSSSTRSGLATK